MTATQRAEKRFRREHRTKKADGSWACPCGQRHARLNRCPNDPALSSRIEKEAAMARAILSLSQGGKR